MKNCLYCKTMCEQAGTYNSDVCKKFEQQESYVIETDNILNFPPVIEVKSKKSKKKKTYVKI